VRDGFHSVPSAEKTLDWQIRFPRMGNREHEMDDVYLIIGLGNPGREYARTRHNIGFRIVDRLAQVLGVRFARRQSHAFAASAAQGKTKLVLAKPQTFMNLSGQAVAGLIRFYKVPLSHLLVCCDDIDLPLGTIRLRASGGSAGQRGVQSILDSLGTKEVPRLRFGVGRPPGRMDPKDYVLSRFEAEEEEFVPEIIERAARAALTFVDRGMTEAMNTYNSSSAPEGPEPNTPE
jgi:PTH1 family peptidyl-tRNA hydrolase